MKYDHSSYKLLTSISIYVSFVIIWLSFISGKLKLKWKLWRPVHNVPLKKFQLMHHIQVWMLADNSIFRQYRWETKLYFHIMPTAGSTLKLKPKQASHDYISIYFQTVYIDCATITAWQQICSTNNWVRKTSKTGICRTRN
jgi:hypothetical protein